MFSRRAYVPKYGTYGERRCPHLRRIVDLAKSIFGSDLEDVNVRDNIVSFTVDPVFVVIEWLRDDTYKWNWMLADTLALEERVGKKWFDFFELADIVHSLAFSERIVPDRVDYGGYDDLQDFLDTLYDALPVINDIIDMAIQEFLGLPYSSPPPSRLSSSWYLPSHLRRMTYTDTHLVGKLDELEARLSNNLNAWIQLGDNQEDAGLDELPSVTEGMSDVTCLEAADVIYSLLKQLKKAAEALHAGKSVNVSSMRTFVIHLILGVTEQACFVQNVSEEDAERIESKVEVYKVLRDVLDIVEDGSSQADINKKREVAIIVTEILLKLVRDLRECASTAKLRKEDVGIPFNNPALRRLREANRVLSQAIGASQDCRVYW